MTVEEEQRALNTLEAMDNEDFEQFLDSLPLRTQMMVSSGLVDWREVLPRWYLSKLTPIKEGA